MRAVLAELATVQHIDAHTRQEAELRLGEVAKAIGRRPIAEPTPDERAVMREVARRLQDAADPSAGDEARWDSEHPAVSRVAPRADAARIWLLLAAHGEHDDELLDGIRRAARDESPEVRRRVAEAAWWLRDTEEHVAWELAEQLAAAEPRWNVAVTNLDNLRALATLDRERALAAVVSLHRRMLAAGAPNWAVAASSVQRLAHWVDHGAAAGHELDRVVDLAATDPDRADHAISPWRQILTAGDATEEATARRSRAIEMWTRIAEAALTPFERLITADDRNEDQLKPSATSCSRSRQRSSSPPAPPVSTAIPTTGSRPPSSTPVYGRRRPRCSTPPAASEFPQPRTTSSRPSPHTSTTTPRASCAG